MIMELIYNKLAGFVPFHVIMVKLEESSVKLAVMEFGGFSNKFRFRLVLLFFDHV